MVPKCPLLKALYREYIEGQQRIQIVEETEELFVSSQRQEIH